MTKSRLILTAVIAGVAAMPAFAMTSPTSQAEAQEWLEIKVSLVETTKLEPPAEGQDVNATAEVLKAFKSPSGLKEGDTIKIQYTYDPKPKYSDDGKRMLGPSSPALLRNGRQTYAFLNKGEGDDVYTPGASAWSFAPPFGIPKEERDKLGLKAPTPPKTPPPPPPASFRVPMKPPAAGAMPASPGKPPSTTPPPPPAPEQETEQTGDDS
ncbi:hypothetical protein [Rubellicoccus peritrichatus]|uniref:Uncharacterized protein n=1 Tax=Rubellicoccus peritrichatus TaxID=3080537 RepID=A0AAQ3LFI3_9BACT|nr:hypothetical protein [Puniceicoccus sp. CR14]WOO41074.1 hypothetical protein RZN69_20840 [Puniceicoccus sp. CR14]